MKVRKLDNNHDWTFGVGINNYIDGSEAIAQCVLTNLLSFKRDWFLDRDEGVDWFKYLEKKPDINGLIYEIRNEVFKVDGVVNVNDLSISLDRETRKFIIQVSYIDKFNNSREISTDVTNN